MKAHWPNPVRDLSADVTVSRAGLEAVRRMVANVRSYVRLVVAVVNRVVALNCVGTRWMIIGSRIGVPGRWFEQPRPHVVDPRSHVRTERIAERQRYHQPGVQPANTERRSHQAEQLARRDKRRDPDARSCL